MTRALEAEHRRTLWWRTAGPEDAASPAPAPPDGSRVDVAVVGGGFLGLTAALHLARRGRRVAVLEAERVGSGASGVNAGFVVPNFAKADPAAVVKRLGRTRGETLLRMVGMGGTRVFETVRENAIACDAEETGWLHVAHSPAALEVLRVRAEAWRSLGRPVRLLEREEARALSGARLCAGALLDESGGMLNPLAYARGLAGVALGAGAMIAEGTRIDAVEREGADWRLRHAGGSLLAARVLLCTNAFRTGVARRLADAVVPLQVYQAATAPLSAEEARRLAPGRHPAADTRANLFTYRLDAENRLISGGMSMLPVGAHARMGRMISRRLADELRLPAVPPLEHVWTGRAAMVPDFLPHVFEFGPGFLGGIGCNGRGIALTAMLGEALADASCGVPLAELPVPSGPARPLPFAPLARIAPSFAIAQARWQDRRIGREA
ncbi:FAD-binding oxidoreductase [Aureimonas sp. AU4]|uniref:NAD(P)/FAD-dependent oxidoreductase n=1 Tax=Aureimonas sp. AU4 TaxID=1638163 RepID=UPI000783D85C|nr:FAD-dependent oxidoreductase [Aureimonas sp. AU4]